jgi:beta-lactamase regulating signal transducer with metallopeptidase domain/tetratricopeptide (TPR) repeat protein
MTENLAVAVRFALDLVFKATVLMLVTGAVLFVLRRASAAVRQMVATLGLTGVLVLPAASLLAPRWEIPLIPNPVPAMPSIDAAFGSLESRRTVKEPESIAVPAVAEEKVVSAPMRRRAPSFEASAAGDGDVSGARDFEPVGGTSKKPSSPMWWMFGSLALWSFGTALASIRLVLGAARVARIRRRASGEVDSDWTDLSIGLAAKLGLPRPVRLLFSAEVAVPVTAGVLRPVVLLPERARRWNDERRRVVLLHELAHVLRADWVALLIGQAASAVYWFHPLAWSIRVHMQKDCERACDDVVLAAGTRPSVYAAHLLSIIRSLRLSHQRALPAVAMARRSYWDGRMRAILDPAVARRGVSGREARIAGAAIVAAVVGLAVFEPWMPHRADAMAATPAISGAAVDFPSGELSSECPEKKSKESKKPVAREKEISRPASPFVIQSSVSPGAVPVSPAAASSLEVTAWAEPAEQPPPAAAKSGFVPASRRHGQSGGDWYSRGMELHNEGNYDEAIAAFGHAIEEGTRVDAATYNIACGYARKGNADRAVEWLRKSLREGFDLASYIDKDDDLDGLRSDPRFIELRRNLRTEKTEANRHHADRLAERSRELQASRATKSGAELYSVGKELLDAGRYDLAAQAFQASAARGHREGASLYNTACALALKGDKASALDYLQKALEAGFDDVGLFRKDDDLDNVRGEPRYRELLKMAQSLELHRFQDWGNMKSWTRAGRRNAWRETEQHFADYVHSHPQSGRAWYNLGYARIEGDRPEAAAEAFQRALDLRYRTATTMYNLACAYSLMDRKDEAFAWLFKSLDAGFDASGTLRGDDDLDNLRGDPRYRQALARVKKLDDEDD